MRTFGWVAVFNLAVWLLLRDHVALIWVPLVWSSLLILPLRRMADEEGGTFTLLAMVAGIDMFWAWSAGYDNALPFLAAGFVLALCYPPTLNRKLAPAILAAWAVAWFSGAKGGPGSMIAFFENRFHMAPDQAEVAVVVLRKTIHFTSYGTMAVFFRRAGASTWAALGAAFMVACGDEGRQWFTPGRTGQWPDVVLDMVGAGVFVGLWEFMVRRSWLLEGRSGSATTNDGPRT